MPNYNTPAQALSASALATGQRATALAERRRRGEISCAECSRLKMGCDKRIPCTPCLRRQCSHLCPNGTNVTADGPKLVLAATNHLHEDIAALRDRIRNLEGALGPMHFTRTGTTHPLLGPRLDINWDDDDILISESSFEIENREANDDTSALATSPDGSTRIFGSIGSALVHALTNDRSFFHGERLPDDDVELIRCLRQFPFTPVPPPDIQYILEVLRSHIPSWEVYDPLIDVFHGECGSTYLIAFTPEYIERSLIPATRNAEGRHGLYALGSFFALLGIGCLFAVPGPETAPEVRHYSRLSSIAISASGVLASPSLELIEALYVRAILELFQQATLEETARSTLYLACQMCYDMGLHMDGSGWNKLGVEERCRRSSVFWMVFTTDVWETVTTGRPTRMVVDLNYMDIKLPTIPSTPSHSSMDIFHMIAHTALLFAEVSLVTQSRQAPHYSRIVELDEKVRKHWATPGFDINKPAVVPPPSMINIYLHCGFFTRALVENPADPLKSEFSVSVHGALRGARETLVWLGMLLEINPSSCARLHYVWSMGLAAATILITLLERAPLCLEARDTRRQFESAIPLFAMGAKFGSRRAKNSLGILCARLRKLPRSTHEAVPDTFLTSWYLSCPDLSESPVSSSANELVALVKDVAMIPSSSISPTPRRRALPRTVSLPVIPGRAALSAENPPDGTLYRSCFLRPHRQDSALASIPITSALMQDIPP